MPLAWLLGQDDDPLYGLASGVLHPSHVCLVGVRSFEPEEEARLKRLGVRVIMIEEVRERGLEAVFDEALGIATSGTEAFGISVDLDVVTPDEVPAVGTPVEGGIAAQDLARAIKRIGGRRDLAAVELVEYCPRLDRDGRSAKAAVEILAAALCGARQDPQVVAETLHGHHA
jgi:arginase